MKNNPIFKKIQTAASAAELELADIDNYSKATMKSDISASVAEQEWIDKNEAGIRWLLKREKEVKSFSNNLISVVNLLKLTFPKVQAEWFEEVSSVGVSAGASTPNDIIDEVIEKIQLITAQQLASPHK